MDISSMVLSRRFREYRVSRLQLLLMAQSTPVTTSCCFIGFILGSIAGSRGSALVARKSTFSMKRPAVTPGAGPVGVQACGAGEPPLTLKRGAVGVSAAYLGEP